MFGDTTVQHPATGIRKFEENVDRFAGRQHRRVLPGEISFGTPLRETARTTLAEDARRGFARYGLRFAAAMARENCRMVLLSARSSGERVT
jgi:hypothetical protein